MFLAWIYLLTCLLPYWFCFSLDNAPCKYKNRATILPTWAWGWFVAVLCHLTETNGRDRDVTVHWALFVLSRMFVLLFLLGVWFYITVTVWYVWENFLLTFIVVWFATSVSALPTLNCGNQILFKFLSILITHTHTHTPSGDITVWVKKQLHVIEEKLVSKIKQKVWSWTAEWIIFIINNLISMYKRHDAVCVCVCVQQLQTVQYILSRVVCGWRLFPAVLRQ